jgi:hypothetical protein
MAGETDGEVEQGPAHTERHLNPISGETVYVFCDCPIGQEHTYGDWVARFGVPPAVRP